MHAALWKLLSLVAFLGVSLAQNADCPEMPDVAVIVAASVFGTLAVVLLVIGIIIFYLWRRKKALKLQHRADKNEKEPGVAYTNPAFKGDSPDGPDLKTIEEGEATTGYVACKEFTTIGIKTPTKSNGAGDPGKKTWASLPRADFPGNNFTRNSSAGSLDKYVGVDSEVISVQLQSHDFIGLGFNIAGSMRDGIYVSQVHNRGPAIESGKFNIGDRIKSVTISFENMVFEDALTILSYASPYLVKVTLQKEKYTNKERRPSDYSMQLNHPLYRSQSLDALLKIGKDPIFKPQRSSSEICDPETVNQTKTNLLMENEGKQDPLNGSKNNYEMNMTMPGDSSSEQSNGSTVVEITVHKTGKDRSQEPSYKKLPGKILDDIQQNAALQEYSSSVPEANMELENEVVLTSIKMDESSNRSSQNSVDFHNDNHITASANMNSLMSTPKPTPPIVADCDDSETPPIKPERKKKKVSMSSSSQEESDTSQLSSPVTPSKISPDDIVLETDIPLRFSLAVGAYTPAVEEDIFVANRKSRNGPTGNNELDISARGETVDSFVSVSDISKTLVGYNMSVSDLDGTLRSPLSGEMKPAHEDTITAVNIERDTAVPSTDKEIQMSIESGLAKMNGHEDIDSNIQMRKSKSKTDKKLDLLLANNLSDSTKTFESITSPSWDNEQRLSSMSFDISMEEISAFESEVQEELRRSQSETPKGSVAFEMRDSIVTGFPLNDDDDETRDNTIKTISYDQKFPSENLESTSSLRGGFLKLSGENPLDWSEEELVRSGLFSKIPQDNPIKNWTDCNALDRDDVIIVDVKDNTASDFQINHSSIFTTQENLVNISDLSDSMKSDSSSSSKTNSPPPPLHKTTNGNGSGLETIIDLSIEKSPVTFSERSTGMLIETDRPTTESVTVSRKGDSPETFTVVLNMNSDNDADC